MSESSESKRPDAALGQLLLRAKLVTDEELETARGIQRKTRERLETVLIREGYIESSTLADFLARVESMAKVRLEGFDFDPELIALIPPEMAMKYRAVPVDRIGKALTLAVSAPLDEASENVIAEQSGLRVKAILCSDQDVQNALSQYYGAPSDDPDRRAALLETPLKLQTAVSMLRHIDQLPGLPGTVMRVREMLYTDEGSAADAAEVISRDPAVAAKVLRVANSAAYGFAHRVDNIDLAVSLLGLVETYSVVVSTSVINVFDRSKTFDYMNFWLESMVCASVATAISKSIDTKTRSGVFSAGLLHDIGRVALAEVAPRHYGRVDRSLTGTALTDQESHLIGLTHTEAGYQLAQHWGLPEEIAETVRFHHTPAYASPENRALVSMVNIADVLSRAHRADAESRIPDLTECRESMAYLEMNDEDLMAIFRELPKPDEGDSLWSPN